MVSRNKAIKQRCTGMQTDQFEKRYARTLGPLRIWWLDVEPGTISVGKARCRVTEPPSHVTMRHSSRAAARRARHRVKDASQMSPPAAASRPARAGHWVNRHINLTGTKATGIETAPRCRVTRPTGRCHCRYLGIVQPITNCTVVNNAVSEWSVSGCPTCRTCTCVDIDHLRSPVFPGTWLYSQERTASNAGTISRQMPTTEIE